MASTQARKSVIVTGGASGIGLGMTRHFASQGHAVSILDINGNVGPRIAAELAAELAAEHPQAAVSFKRVDVSSWEEQAAAFEEVYREHGRIDVVMANAGISEQGKSSISAVEEDAPVKPDTKSIEVNLLGVIYSVKLALHYMHKNKDDNSASRGSVIITASSAGLYPFPVAPLYGTSKAGIINLARSLGPAFEKSNIQVNALAPVVFETNIAPSSDLFKSMVITPMSTLTKGVDQILTNSSITGQVAEIHGDSVTLRPHAEFVDEDTKKNMEKFWDLGYA